MSAQCVRLHRRPVSEASVGAPDDGLVKLGVDDLRLRGDLPDTGEREPGFAAAQRAEVGAEQL